MPRGTLDLATTSDHARGFAPNPLGAGLDYFKLRGSVRKHGLGRLALVIVT